MASTGSELSAPVHTASDRHDRVAVKDLHRGEEQNARDHITTFLARTE